MQSSAVICAGHMQQHVSLLGEDGIEGVRAFWREARKCETLRALCDSAGHESIPLLVHFDGIGTFRNFEHDVWSFSSAMTHGTGGSIYDKKFPRMVLDHDRIPPNMVHELHDRVAAFTAWEQDSLLDGGATHCLDSMGRHCREQDPASPCCSMRACSGGKVISKLAWRHSAFPGIIGHCTCVMLAMRS